MFGLKKKGPTRPFTHAGNCKISKADPTVQIQWSEVETGHWRAVCQCGSQDIYEDAPVGRVRLDPYDPSTFQHAGGCEHRHTSDPALLRLILKVRDGAGGLLVGGMRRLRARLAGSALRRERRVTTR